MASPRRRRLLLLVLILAIVTVIYVTTGAQRTRSSPFYKRTMALMEERRGKREQALGLAGREINGDPSVAGRDIGATVDGGVDGSTSAAEGTEKLKGRLKEAEEQAKKSADTKWKHAADAAEGLAKDTPPLPPSPAQPKEKTVARRKKFPIPTDIDSPHAVADSKEDGVAHDGPHAAIVGAGAGAQEALLLKTGSDAAPDIEVTDAAAELARLLTLSPVLIFSKSHCPYSRKAKSILLENYTITPTPHVVELDLLEGGLGQRLQGLLRERTGRGTVPNVMVGGVSIGGGDDVEDMWREDRLTDVIEKAAGREVKSVVLNQGPMGGVGGGGGA